MDRLPTLVPLTPERIRAILRDDRVRARARAACIRGAVVTDELATAVAATVRADGSTSLFVAQSALADRIADLIGHHPSPFERGFIAGLALAIATEVEEG